MPRVSFFASILREHARSYMRCFGTLDMNRFA